MGNQVIRTFNTSDPHMFFGNITLVNGVGVTGGIGCHFLRTNYNNYSLRLYLKNTVHSLENEPHALIMACLVCSCLK